jgi:hypothetical protein
LLAYASVLAAAIILPLSGFAADPGWTDPAMKAAGAAALLAAGLLWIARRPLPVALGIALAPAAIAAGVLSIAARLDTEGEPPDSKWGGYVFAFHDRGRTKPLSAAELASVPKGATRAQVRRLLGPPIAHGIQRVEDARDPRCLAYPNEHFKRKSRANLHAFCFRDGRFVVLRNW